MKFSSMVFAPEGGTGAAAPPPPPATPPAWHAAFASDNDLTAHITTRGWDKLDPAAAAAAAVKAHFEAQKHIGVPAEQLVRLPKDANDVSGTDALWQRLGKPKDAAGYDFSAVKKKDGTEPEAKFTDFLRATALKLNLPKDTAGQLAAALVGFNDQQAVDSAAETAATLGTAKQALDKEWGANAAANRLIAQNAARKLGLTAEQVAAFETNVGYGAVMNMFLKIGQAIGEDTFVGGKGPNGDGVMTVQQAQARKNELMRDDAWAKRYLNGGANERKEMENLNKLITGTTG